MSKKREEWEEDCISAIIGLLCDESVDSKPKPGKNFKPYLKGLTRFAELLRKDRDFTSSIQYLRDHLEVAKEKIQISDKRIFDLENTPDKIRVKIEEEITRRNAAHKVAIKNLEKQFKNIKEEE